MSYSIVFRILGGSFEEGYEIEAEIRRNQKIICTELGRLPPKPEIPQLYEQTFPVHYANWGSRSQWGRAIDYGDGVEAVRSLCLDTSQELARTFQIWFRHADLGAIQTRIIQNIPSGSEPVVILEANRHRVLQCLPWHQWDWLSNEFPNTEIVLSRKAFRVDYIQKRQRILVILGSEEGIDLQPDWEALTKNLNPIADLILLSQPTLNQLRDQISQGCDILFFAGHSDRNQAGDNGWIKINAAQTISIDDLVPELRLAIKKGLKLIVLNSCSGMGIASRLSELEIPYMVVMREPIHNDVAGKFIEYCLKDLADGNSLTKSVSQARNKLRNLEDKYICASWMPIIFQSREAPDYIPFPRKIWQQIWHELSLLHISLLLPQLITIPSKGRIVKVPRIFFIAIGLVTAFAINAYFNQSPEILESMGERSLFLQQLSAHKQNGIAAFKAKDYDRAVEQFNISLAAQPNDPEARIYLNNSLVLQQVKDFKALQIIPVISSASNGYSTAVEVLIGAGIAQMDINQQGGIRGRKILIEIVLDQNDDEIAKKVAQKLIKEDIQGVVGHVESNSSVAAAPFYEKAGIVMVSPTSSTMNLTNSGQYIFRTTPNSEMIVKTLADYVSNIAKKKKLGFCMDSTLTAANTFRNAFIANISRQGGNIVAVNCDVSDPTFSPQLIVENMRRQGADGLVLYYHLNKPHQFEASKNLAKVATKLNLALFGSHSLVASDILESGNIFDGMVLATPRHPDLPFAQTFSNKVKKTFAIEPNWRSMTSYDAEGVTRTT